MGLKLDTSVLRPAMPGDIDALCELETLCFATEEEMLSRRQIRYLIGSPHARVIVAERGDRIVGWTVGLIRRHRASRSGRVYAVAVHPDCQGQGLGRQLFEAVLDALREHRITRVYLEVRRDNAKARKLYEQFGFTEHAPLPDYYGKRRHGVRMKRLT